MAKTVILLVVSFVAHCLLTAFAGCTCSENPHSFQQSNHSHSSHQDMTTTGSDYEPIPLPRLIGLADFILMGTVVAVEAETFTFKIEEELSGDAGKGEITLQQFIPNKFDGPRAAPYELGQRFMLFLKKDTSENVLKILGRGGEGEMPIESGFVYFQGRHVEGLERKAYSVHQTERMIQRFDCQVFATAVKDFRSCYTCEFDPVQERYKCQKTCGTSEFQEMEKKSFIHRHLTSSAE